MPSDLCNYGSLKNKYFFGVLFTKSGEQSGIHRNDMFPGSDPFEHMQLVQGTKSSD